MANPPPRPSSTPSVIPGTIPALQSYINRDTSYWIKSPEAGGGGIPLIGTSLEIISGDGTQTGTTSFVGDRLNTVITDSTGAGSSDTVMSFIPVGARPARDYIGRFDTISIVPHSDYTSGGGLAGNGLLTIANQFSTNTATNVLAIGVPGASGNIKLSQFVQPANVEDVILSISSGTGATTFNHPIFAPNIQLAQTTTNQLIGAWGSAPYPSTITGGLVAGQTYTAPRAGLYIVFYDYGFNVDNSLPIVAGASDLIITALVQVGTGIIPKSNCTLRPIPMNATNDTPPGIDYNQSGSDVYSMTAGEVVQLTRYVYNPSGTLALGAINSAVATTIIPLC